MTIERADGRRHLDCLSSARTLLGDNHPEVLEAMRAVLGSLPFRPFRTPHDSGVRAR